MGVSVCFGGDGVGQLWGWEETCVFVCMIVRECKHVCLSACVHEWVS